MPSHIVSPDRITKDEAAALENINPQHMLDQVSDWAQINSGTGNLDGLAQMADRLQTAFAALPGNVQLIQPEPVETMDDKGEISTIERGAHLQLSVRPKANLRLLLTGHMDTVFPLGGGFDRLKWLDDHTLNGPGVADMKGGIAVMLAALQALEQSEFASAIGYDVMINSDEETGSGASAALIKQLANGKAAAMTYEPALPDGTLAGARGGSGNFSIHITGKSAHAGRNPDKGRNAIVAAADLAVQLKALSREDLSVNPAKIEGGGANNVVPDRAILRVNFRPKTPNAEQYAQKSLDALIAKIAADHDVAAHRHGGFGRPPKPIDAGAEKLFQLVKHCGAALDLDIAWRSTGGVCDGNNISACGVPVVDTMGVRGGAIHSHDEYLIVPSLAERARLSALTLMRISQRGGL